MTVLLLLLVQAVPGGPQEPLRDWSYQRKEINPKTGREEVTAIIGGAEARPVNLTPKKEIVEVRKVKARYFTEPRGPEDPSVEVNLWAERGRMDNAARTLRVEEGVRVLRLSDGALLETREAIVHFPLKYVCVTCDPRRELAPPCPGCRAPLQGKTDTCPACGLDFADKPLKCPVCGSALRDKSFTSVEVPGPFSFTGPEGVLRGDGLVSDDSLRSTRVTRNGYLEIAGTPADLAKPPGARPDGKPKVAQLACRGPLTIEETEKDVRTLIRAREAVRLDRIDETGTSIARADEADIVVLRTPLGPQVEELRARGNVDLDSVSFSDGMGVTARGDTLDWTHRDLTFWSEDFARVEGAPAVARVGPNEVRAKRMRFTGPEGRGEFEGDVKADLVPDRPEGPKRRVALSAERLTTQAVASAPAGWELRDVEATGRVLLSGLLPGESDAPGSAEAERFRWDLIDQRGLLESPRFVRIVQGTNTILAPRVIVEDGGSTVVLKGPKEIRFSQAAPNGTVEEYRATSEGDAVLQSGATAAQAGRIRLERACALRTKDFRMTCDRVDAILGKGGQGLQSLRAFGNVRADRSADGIHLFGDRMTYDPSKKELELFGTPFAVAEGSRMVSHQERLVFYERANGKPGETIRFMEMRRGSAPGIRISLTSEPKK